MVLGGVLLIVPLKRGTGMLAELLDKEINLSGILAAEGNEHFAGGVLVLQPRAQLGHERIVEILDGRADQNICVEQDRIVDFGIQGKLSGQRMAHEDAVGRRPVMAVYVW